MYLVLLGAPGAGKGTQAALLSQNMGLAHVATGDMFREAVRQGTELGKLAKSYMDRGELVPDDVTIRMLLERLSRPDCQNGCMLDGFPRTLEQARALDEALTREGKAIDKAVYIKVSPEELVSRLSGRWTCRQCGAVYHEVNNPPETVGRCDNCSGELYQRDDDRPETVRNRLAVYFQQTAPVIDYYSSKGKLVEVNGEQTMEKVTADLLQVLGQEVSR